MSMARSDYVTLRLFSGPELPVDTVNMQFVNLPLKDMRRAANLAAEMISYRQLVSIGENEDALAMARRLSELSDVAQLTGKHFSTKCEYTDRVDQQLEALHRFGVSSVFQGLSLRYSLNFLFQTNAPDHVFFRDYATLSMLEIMAKSDKVAMPVRARKAIDRQFQMRSDEFPRQAAIQNKRVVSFIYDYMGEMNERQ